MSLWDISHPVTITVANKQNSFFTFLEVGSLRPEHQSCLVLRRMAFEVADICLVSLHHRKSHLVLWPLYISCEDTSTIHRDPILVA